MKPVKPLLIQPEDILNLRSKHCAELIEGYFRAKYGFMKEFKDMYNEGITMLTDNGVPLKVQYLDRFLNLLRKKFYPDYEMPERAPLRLFEISYGERKKEQIDGVVTIAQLINTWPFLTQIIESPDFKRVRITTESSEIRVERVQEAQVLPDKKEK